MSECTCPEIDGMEFWCERHQTYKTQLLRRKCLDRGAFWVQWEQGKGPRRTELLSTLASVIASPRGAKSTGCGKNKTTRKKDPDRYSDNYDEPTEILELCLVCEHYNADTEHCEQSDCRRLKAKTCLERIVNPRQKCPIGQW